MLKEMLKRLEELEIAADKADALYEQNPEDEAAERAFDEAYNAEWEAFNELAEMIVKSVPGVDTSTANIMIRQHRDQLHRIASLEA